MIMSSIDRDLPAHAYSFQTKIEPLERGKGMTA
jgi:hypothetical protein